MEDDFSQFALDEPRQTQSAPEVEFDVRITKEDYGKIADDIIQRLKQIVQDEEAELEGGKEDDVEVGYDADGAEAAEYAGCADDTDDTDDAHALYQQEEEEQVEAEQTAESPTAEVDPEEKRKQEERKKWKSERNKRNKKKKKLSKADKKQKAEQAKQKVDDWREDVEAQGPAQQSHNDDAKGPEPEAKGKEKTVETKQDPARAETKAEREKAGMAKMDNIRGRVASQLRAIRESIVELDCESRNQGLAPWKEGLLKVRVREAEALESIIDNILFKSPKRVFFPAVLLVLEETFRDLDAEIVCALQLIEGKSDEEIRGIQQDGLEEVGTARALFLESLIARREYGGNA